MRIVNVKFSSLPTEVLRIGKVGENEHTEVKIDCGQIFTDYPNATVLLAVKSPRGQVYPVTISVSSGKVVWDISDYDVAYPGGGAFQLTFTNGDEIIKSAIGRTYIDESLVPNSGYPSPALDWLVEAQAALEAFDQDVSDAEAWAHGTRGGVEIIDPNDPAYQKNAKYYADLLDIHVSGTTLIIN